MVGAIVDEVTFIAMVADCVNDFNVVVASVFNDVVSFIVFVDDDPENIFCVFEGLGAILLLVVVDVVVLVVVSVVFVVKSLTVLVGVALFIIVVAIDEPNNAKNTCLEL